MVGRREVPPPRQLHPTLPFREARTTSEAGGVGGQNRPNRPHRTSIPWPATARPSGSRRGRWRGPGWGGDRGGRGRPVEVRGRREGPREPPLVRSRGQTAGPTLGGRTRRLGRSWGLTDPSWAPERPVAASRGVMATGWNPVVSGAKADLLGGPREVLWTFVGRSGKAKEGRLGRNPAPPPHVHPRSPGHAVRPYLIHPPGRPPPDAPARRPPEP